MSTTKGQQKVKIGGQLRPIKFGTNATDIFCREWDIELWQYNELFSVEKMQKLQIKGGEIRDLVWAGLKAAALSNGEDVDFNKYQVGDWIDSMSEDEMAKVWEVFYNDIAPPKKKKPAAKK